MWTTNTQNKHLKTHTHTHTGTRTCVSAADKYYYVEMDKIKENSESESCRAHWLLACVTLCSPHTHIHGHICVIISIVFEHQSNHYLTRVCCWCVCCFYCFFGTHKYVYVLWPKSISWLSVLMFSFWAYCYLMHNRKPHYTSRIVSIRSDFVWCTFFFITENMVTKLAVRKGYLCMVLQNNVLNQKYW